MNIIEEPKFNKEGLIPTIIQDKKSGKVLTLCYMNKDAVEKTLAEKKIYVFRRSQNRLMLKGETSGHIQEVCGVFPDCECNSILFTVKQNIAACHAGYFSCYYRQLVDGELAVSEEKVFDPDNVY